MHYAPKAMKFKLIVHTRDKIKCKAFAGLRNSRITQKSKINLGVELISEKAELRPIRVKKHQPTVKNPISFVRKCTSFEANSITALQTRKYRILSSIYSN
ncbi:hypothetical protein V6Z11_A05G077000 [Gossypium hirsutum]